VVEPPIIFRKGDDGVAWLTLNRPELLNAVNMEARDLLWGCLLGVRDDPDVRAAVFTGEGDRAFSAGADITEFGTAPSFVDARRARRERDLWGLMAALPKPLVAAVHGYAYGAGCELALLCDIRIASGDARFGLPEVSLGYVPSAGGTQTLPRTIPPGVARELIYSGRPIAAQRAFALGLVQRVVPRDSLLEAAAAVAASIAAMPAGSVQRVKEAMIRGAGLPLESALAVERMIAVRPSNETA
jgi:enoyl-CoA hydratase/carnithine racemase